MSRLTNPVVNPGDTVSIRCANPKCLRRIVFTLAETKWWAYIPSFHSAACQRNWRKDLDRQERWPGCPHPDKKSFRSDHEARALANEMSAGMSQVFRVYRCDCGALHVGHSSVVIIRRAGAEETA